MSLLFAIALAASSPVATEVTAPGPAGVLKGTMLSLAPPRGPVMLIIPGSGPTDRDGNNPLGVSAATYKLLAEGLAERGVTTVRIDKRGMFGSGAAVPDANAVTVADYATDVGAWTAAIRKRTGAPCVWLLGHSEGGLVALVAGREKDVCGLVLVSAGGRPVGEVLREQLRSNPANAPILDQAMTAIDSLEAGKMAETVHMHPALLQLFAPQVQKYLVSLFSYDPATLIAGYSRPVLIVQGQRDIQVSEQDARRLKAALPRAKLVLLPDANHVLKAVPSDDRAANAATYSDPALPLAPNVVATIADFVLAEGKAR